MQERLAKRIRSLANNGGKRVGKGLIVLPGDIHHNFRFRQPSHSRCQLCCWQFLGTPGRGPKANRQQDLARARGTGGINRVDNVGLQNIYCCRPEVPEHTGERSAPIFAPIRAHFNSAIEHRLSYDKRLISTVWQQRQHLFPFPDAKKGLVQQLLSLPGSLFHPGLHVTFHPSPFTLYLLLSPCLSVQLANKSLIGFELEANVASKCTYVH